MDNKKFSKDLLNKIKKENIKQTPKYIFLLKNIFVWFFLFVSIFLGALSFSISIDYLINADWYLFNRIGLFKIFLIFIPFFWIIFLVLSSFLSYYNFRHTNKGYKLSLLKVFIINILLSLLIAIILYFSGANNYIESKIEKYIPKYRSVLVDDKVSRMLKVWQNENNGLLIGEIIEVYDKKLSFKDYNNKTWNIDINQNTTTDIKHRVNISKGEKIKIIGEKVDENNFKAIEIRPFMGKIKK